MDQLCDDLLSMIFQFCDDRTSYNLSLCNKYINESTRKKGFAKFLSYDYPLCDYNKFMKRYIRHHGTINIFVIRHTNNPFYWLPKWVSRVHFENCRIKDPINPNEITSTEVLSIVTPIFDWEIKINWDKFPHLKELYVKGYAIESFEGIEEKCKRLKKITYLPEDSNKISKINSVNNFSKFILKVI